MKEVIKISIDKDTTKVEYDFEACYNYKYQILKELDLLKQKLMLDINEEEK